VYLIYTEGSKEVLANPHIYSGWDDPSCQGDLKFWALPLHEQSIDLSGTAD